MSSERGEGRGRPGCIPGLILAIGALIGGLFLRHEISLRDGEIPPDHRTLAAGHELRDMRPAQVITWLGLLAIAIILLVGAVTVFERLAVGHIGNIQAVVANPPNETSPPAPRLETSNGQVLGQLHVKEDQLLNNYSWIDQAAGTVRIPIERAIELTAQRGLPTSSQAAGQVQQGALTRPEDSSSGRTSEHIP